MKSVKNDRAKELKFRSACPADEKRKSQKDAWNKPEGMYLDRTEGKDVVHTIGDAVLNTMTIPLDDAITDDFRSSLSECERNRVEDRSAGSMEKDNAQHHHVTPARLKTLRHDLEVKAVEYL